MRPQTQRRGDPIQERERIEAAMFELVLEHGYPETTAEGVWKRAEVSRQAFHSHFPDLQSCVVAVYDRINDEFNRQVQAAFRASPDWRTSLRAAAYAAADFLVAHPREVRFCTVAIADAGEMVAARRDANLQRFVDLIDAGRAELADPTAVGREVAEAAVGAVFERLLRTASRSGDARRAHDLVPELMYLAVRPYVGHAEALKELSAPPPSALVDVSEAAAGVAADPTKTTCATGSAIELGLDGVTRRPSPHEEEAARLARLPPGRHGLSREFVAQNQRDRLTAGMIACVAEKGYRGTTVADVSAAAGVSRRTFYGYFSSKEECYLATYDMVAGHLREASLAAGEGERSWAGGVRAEITGAMEFFAANPDLVRFYLIAPPRAGEAIAERYRLGARRVLAQLATGAPRRARRPSPDVLNAISGGMAALIARKVEAGEGETLTELVPDLCEHFLTPFIGRAEAARVARAH
jgi:AcrR family transcriptional regulator